MRERDNASSISLEKMSSASSLVTLSSRVGRMVRLPAFILAEMEMSVGCAIEAGGWTAFSESDPEVAGEESDPGA